MAQSSGTLSGKFSSPRRQRQIFLGSAAVFAAGVIAFLAVVLLRGSGNRFTDTFSNQPAQLAKKERVTKPTAEEYAVARRFIETAVARKNLDASYDLVHVDLKGRMTRKQWDTGNIPVVDYPANNAKTAAFTTEYSYADQGLFDVDLVAKPGSTVRPHLLFFIGLKKEHGKWLVNYWEPHWRPPIPQAVN